jgi:hypothetical protein
MRNTFVFLITVGLTVGFNSFPIAEAGPCPPSFESIVVADGVQCAHPDEIPANSTRPTSFYSAAAEARALECFGSGEDGSRLQAVYVTEGPAVLSDADRAAITQGMINVQSIYRSSSLAVSDDVVVPRWVHSDDCRPVIEVVQVAPGALDDFAGGISALAALGHSRPDRKYIMWSDAAEYCGIAAVSIDPSKTNNRNDGDHAGYARIDRACWGYQGSVVAHEVTHTLGAVQPSAPHATPYGHCTDEYDIMCYVDGPDTVTTVSCPSTGSELVLDCNNDDYFHPDPQPGSWLYSNWNVADSSFLERIPGSHVDVGEVPVADSGSGFGDVDSENPHGRAIGWLADRGVTRGCDTGRFCPDQPVTRGQMAAFLHRYVPDRERTAAGIGFGDVGADAPFADDIEWLVSAGITRGCDQSSFCPDQPVSRAQMAAFLYRVFAPGSEAGGAAFVDVGSGALFSTEVGWLAATGISRGCGDGRFCPEQPVTRAEMASFLYRAAEMYLDN